MGLTMNRGSVQIGPHDYCLVNRGTDRDAKVMAESFARAFPGRHTFIENGHLYVDRGYECGPEANGKWEAWANAFRDGYLAGFNECQRIHGTRP